VLGVLALLIVYYVVGGPTNIFLLGIDSREPESNLGRSDTNILITMRPAPPGIGMLSIPRDLWVPIPGYGENRINTAHFFAESDQPGSGPKAVMETVETNFNVPVDYYIRIRFAGLTAVVDALGGLEVDLPRPMSGYPEGRVQMNGEEALAFVRDRQGSDDFFRMERGQLFLQAGFRWALAPNHWPRIPAVIGKLPQFLDTDIPLWLWPRLGTVFLLVGPGEIDNRVITREMVQPFTTTGGAAVLAPDWSQINPLVQEMFGK
jgi:LCP family protein required for cell wall assembly